VAHRGLRMKGELFSPAAGGRGKPQMRDALALWRRKVSDDIYSNQIILLLTFLKCYPSGMEAFWLK
jgi:hypothetical protein